MVQWHNNLQEKDDGGDYISQQFKITNGKKAKPIIYSQKQTIRRNSDIMVDILESVRKQADKGGQFEPNLSEL